MDHLLVGEIEKALGWIGPEDIGRTFAKGAFADVELCAQLLTPQRLLNLIMRRSMSPFHLRCLVDGTEAHPQDYIAMSAERRGRTVPMADMRRIGSLAQAGCTFVVPEVNTYDPFMELACRALQWWSHELVQVNCYLTTGASKGFALHWDDHDVIVVQLAGEKSWEVRGLSRTAPMYRDGEPNLDPPDEIVWKGVLEAGDVMHIPRGYWHRATREDLGDGYSLHATFGLTRRTGVDWLTSLADESRTQELFRHDLIRQLGRDQDDQQYPLTDAAVRLIATQHFRDFLSARERQRPSGRHVRTHGLFGPPSEVVCVTEFRPVIEHGESTITVAAAGRRITLDKSAEPALQVLLSGGPVNVAELEANHDFDVASLVQVLVSEEICAEVTPELSAAYTAHVN